MDQLKHKLLLIAGCLLCLFMLAVFSLRSTSKEIHIASKPDTESNILAEMLKICIEKETGLSVHHVPNLDGTWVCFNALTSGSIDAYVEYSGTALVAILKESPYWSHEEIRACLSDRYNLTWLEPLGFENSYVLLVNQDSPLQKISDISNHTLGVDPELFCRKEFHDLRQAYTLPEPDLVDQNLLFLTGLDVITASLIDPRVPKYRLRPLIDDKRVMPTYEPVPLFRTQTLNQHSKIIDALVPLKNLITADEILQLTIEVDQNHQNPYDCAMNYLQIKGIL